MGTPAPARTLRGNDLPLLASISRNGPSCLASVDNAQPIRARAVLRLWLLPDSSENTELAGAVPSSGAGDAHEQPWR